MQKLAMRPNDASILGRIKNLPVVRGWGLARQGYLRVPGVPKNFKAQSYFPYKSPAREYRLKRELTPSANRPANQLLQVDKKEINSIIQTGRSKGLTKDEIQRNVNSYFKQIDFATRVGHGAGNHPYAVFGGAGIAGTGTLLGARGLLHRQKSRRMADIAFPSQYDYMANKYYPNEELQGLNLYNDLDRFNRALGTGDINKVQWYRSIPGSMLNMNVPFSTLGQGVPKNIRTKGVHFVRNVRNLKELQYKAIKASERRRELGLIIDAKRGDVKFLRGDNYGVAMPRPKGNRAARNKIIGHIHPGEPRQNLASKIRGSRRYGYSDNEAIRSRLAITHAPTNKGKQIGMAFSSSHPSDNDIKAYAKFPHPKGHVILGHEDFTYIPKGQQGNKEIYHIKSGYNVHKVFGLSGINDGLSGDNNKNLNKLNFKYIPRKGLATQGKKLIGRKRLIENIIPNKQLGMTVKNKMSPQEGGRIAMALNNNDINKNDINKNDIQYEGIWNNISDELKNSVIVMANRAGESHSYLKGLLGFAGKGLISAQLALWVLGRSHRRNRIEDMNYVPYARYPNIYMDRAVLRPGRISLMDQNEWRFKNESNGDINKTIKWKHAKMKVNGKWEYPHRRLHPNRAGKNIPTDVRRELLTYARAFRSDPNLQNRAIKLAGRYRETGISLGLPTGEAKFFRGTSEGVSIPQEYDAVKHRITGHTHSKLGRTEPSTEDMNSAIRGKTEFILHPKGFMIGQRKGGQYYYGRFQYVGTKKSLPTNRNMRKWTPPDIATPLINAGRAIRHGAAAHHFTPDKYKEYYKKTTRLLKPEERRALRFPIALGQASQKIRAGVFHGVKHSEGAKYELPQAVNRIAYGAGRVIGKVPGHNILGTPWRHPVATMGMATMGYWGYKKLKQRKANQYASQYANEYATGDAPQSISDRFARKTVKRTAKRIIYVASKGIATQDIRKGNPIKAIERFLTTGRIKQVKSKGLFPPNPQALARKNPKKIQWYKHYVIPKWVTTPSLGHYGYGQSHPISSREIPRHIRQPLVNRLWQVRHNKPLQAKASRAASRGREMSIALNEQTGKARFKRGDRTSVQSMVPFKDEIIGHTHSVDDRKEIALLARSSRRSAEKYQDKWFRLNAREFTNTLNPTTPKRSGSYSNPSTIDINLAAKTPYGVTGRKSRFVLGQGDFSFYAPGEKKGEFYSVRSPYRKVFSGNMYKGKFKIISRGKGLVPGLKNATKRVSSFKVVDGMASGKTQSFTLPPLDVKINKVPKNNSPRGTNVPGKPKFNIVGGTNTDNKVYHINNMNKIGVGTRIGVKATRLWRPAERHVRRALWGGAAVITVPYLWNRRKQKLKYAAKPEGQAPTYPPQEYEKVYKRAIPRKRISYKELIARYQSPEWSVGGEAESVHKRFGPKEREDNIELRRLQEKYGRMMNDNRFRPKHKTDPKMTKGVKWFEHTLGQTKKLVSGRSVPRTIRKPLLGNLRQMKLNPNAPANPIFIHGKDGRSFYAQAEGGKYYSAARKVMPSYNVKKSVGGLLMLHPLAVASMGLAAVGTGLYYPSRWAWRRHKARIVANAGIPMNRPQVIQMPTNGNQGPVIIVQGGANSV